MQQRAACWPPALLGVLGALTCQQASLYRDGITFFNHVVAQNHRAREAHLNLGTALLKWNLLDEALAAYRVAGEQRRRTASRRTAPASCSIAWAGSTRRRRRICALCGSICPRYAGALAHLSTLRLDQQRYEEALDLARTAADLEPGHATAWTNRGIALSHLGRRDEALESLDRALTLDPYQQQARDARARILQESAPP